MRRWIIYAILFGVSVIAFNNCSGGFEVLESVGRVSAQCLQKLRTSQKLNGSFDPVICENPENYQCDIRRFRKGVGHQTQQDQQCADIAGIGETCVAVTTFNFDTSQQEIFAEPADLVEGGSYNRDEISCMNTQITDHKIAVVQAEGSRLVDTLESTILNCRARSRQ